jgi:hypothetical protein
VPQETAAELEEMLDLYVYYVRLAKHSAAAVFTTRRYLDTKLEEHRAAALKAAQELAEFRREVMERLEGTRYPHLVYWLLDEYRMRLLVEDCNKNLQ